MANGHKVIFWMGDGNILKLYCGNGCTTLHVY